MRRCARAKRDKALADDAATTEIDALKQADRAVKAATKAKAKARARSRRGPAAFARRQVGDAQVGRARLAARRDADASSTINFTFERRSRCRFDSMDEWRS